MPEGEFEIVDLTADCEQSAREFSRVSLGNDTVDIPDVPWWTRLHYFTPVAAIEYSYSTSIGKDPRTGEAVYLDYFNQFQGQGASQSKKDQHPRRVDKENEVRSKTSAVYTFGLRQERGVWATNVSGKEIYRATDGKEYQGVKAYEMHAKDKRLTEEN